MGRGKVKTKNTDDATMTLNEHLRELRRKIVICLGVFLLFSILSFVFVQYFVDAMLALGENFNYVYLSPSELITAYMKLAVILGIVFSSPVIVWQIWEFVRPGLKESEQISILPAIIAGFVFFVIGAAFCYLMMLPLTLNFLYSFNGSKAITASISFDNYMSFVLSMLVIFGVVFEMPVLCFLLARLGILKMDLMKKGRKIAILLIFIVAAIITPPDVVSQIMTALPMILLYELSVYVVAWAEKKYTKKDNSKIIETGDEK